MNGYSKKNLFTKRGDGPDLAMACQFVLQYIEHIIYSWINKDIVYKIITKKTINTLCYMMSVLFHIILCIIYQYMTYIIACVTYKWYMMAII